MLLKSVFTKNIKGFCRVIVLIVDVVTAEFVYRVNKKMIFARVIFDLKDKSQRKHHEKFMFCIPKKWTVFLNKMFFLLITPRLKFLTAPSH